jgi:hypothetical protein
MEFKEMELYHDKFVIVESLSQVIEMYQVKTFYYQLIPGIRRFRFSMSQDKSYLYYENKNVVSLTEYLLQGSNVNEVYRILEQVLLILEDCHNYLLYPENFCLHPSWIKIDKCKEELKVELLYLPFKPGTNDKYKEYLEQFVRSISKVFNELNEMEGFYYFIRLLEEFRENSTDIDINGHLTDFLKGKENRNLSENMII